MSLLRYGGGPDALAPEALPADAMDQAIGSDMDGAMDHGGAAAGGFVEGNPDNKLTEEAPSEFSPSEDGDGGVPDPS